MADELEFVCEKCVHYEVCDRSSRMIWARLSKEKVCTDFIEVVRCGECKHFCEPFCIRRDDETHRERINMLTVDFCSYGERKDND